ncbi:Nucleolar complex protein 3 [Globomyces sp. JEL0801]|nr:Nucleolar complex protein 3 [Globomyces sp. JEL0801]
MTKGKKTHWKKALKRQNQPKEFEQDDENVLLSDEDLELLNQFKPSQLSFLTNLNLTNNKTSNPKLSKVKKLPITNELMMDDDSENDEDEDNEQNYELVPRAVTEAQESTRLPIINQHGKVIKLKESKTTQKPLETSDVESENESIEQVTKVQQKVTHSDKEIPKAKKLSISEIKESLASHASSIIENPENNIAELKVLRKFCTDKRDQVVKLSLLTQLAVFKDIIPGYRIRKLSEVEQAAQISKEVRKLRNFEETLLANYQQYLQLLDHVSNTKKGGSRDLLHISLQCMCSLLTTHPHFNFRLNLMTAIISKISMKHYPEISKLCCEALGEVFRGDESGEASLEAVKLISDMIYSAKYAVLTMALDPFQYLRLQYELKSENQKEDPAEKKRKADKQHVSKKMRKVNKHLKVIEEEFQEAEAVFDKEERQKIHSETLKFVFLTYFRILKNAPTSHLIPAVLEGLARFAHLINIDFFDDLLNVLKKISNEQQQGYLTGKDTSSNAPITALHCIIAAFELMDSLGGTLKVDLSDFYTSLYIQISRLAFRPGSFDQPRVLSQQFLKQRNEIELMLCGVESMLKKNREVPIERVAAFVKRLASLSLATPGNSALACLYTIKSALTRFPRLHSLMEEDGRVATGVYNPYLDEPNMCNPFATSLWELVPLSNHFHPAIRVYMKHVLSDKPSTDQVDFQTTNIDLNRLSKGKSKTAIELYSTFQPDGFELIPKVKLPLSVQASRKRFLAATKPILDGPTGFSNSEFLTELLDKYE